MRFREIINIIVVLFPLLCYIVYLGQYDETSSKNKNLYLDLALFTSVYLYVKNELLFDEYNMFMIVNISLLLSIIKERKITTLILSIIIIFLYHNIFGYNIYLLTIEYMIYFIISLVDRKKKKIDIYIIIFTIIKLIMSRIYIGKFIFGECLLFVILSLLILYIFKIGESMMDMCINVRKIEKEKLINDSIFKITHEIKNPIAVCKGYLDMFDTNDKEKSEKYVEILKDEIDRTLELLQDFLNFSKINIEKNEMDIAMLIDDIYESYKLYIESSKISFQLDNIDDEIYIDGDYRRLKQVLINILKNSMEAIKQKHIKHGYIKIKTLIEEDNFIIIISDNGIGIDKKTIEEIYKPFYTTKINGTGLGLCFIKDVIEGHNGQINYSSEEGKWTKVKIALKIKEST